MTFYFWIHIISTHALAFVSVFLFFLRAILWHDLSFWLATFIEILVLLLFWIFNIPVCNFVA